MTQKMIETRHLENTTDEHNKFYDIVVVLKDGKYLVLGRWGRIGNKAQQQVKYSGELRSGAVIAADEMLRNRLDHGYHQVSKRMFHVEQIRGIRQ